MMNFERYYLESTRRGFLKQLGGALMGTAMPGGAVGKSLGGITKLPKLTGIGAAVKQLYVIATNFKIDHLKLGIDEEGVDDYLDRYIIPALEDVERYLEDGSRIKIIVGSYKHVLQNAARHAPNQPGGGMTVVEFVANSCEDILFNLGKMLFNNGVIPKEVLDYTKERGHDYEAIQQAEDARMQQAVDNWKKGQPERDKRTEEHRKHAEEWDREYERRTKEYESQFIITITLPKELAKTLYHTLTTALE